MKNALITFVVLLALLGVGTILVVEKYSGEQILPRSIKGFSVQELTRGYERGRRAIRHWWNKVAGDPSDSSGVSSLPTREENHDEKKIIKWQDERGVWHYEYAAPGQNESPASPP